MSGLPRPQKNATLQHGAARLPRSEYLFDENPSLYFAFLDEVAASVALPPSNVTWQAALQAVKTTTADLLKPLSRKVMQLAVETRSYTAAVEATRQLSLPVQRLCEARRDAARTWAVVRAAPGSEPARAAVACSPEQLKELVEGAVFLPTDSGVWTAAAPVPASAGQLLPLDHPRDGGSSGAEVGVNVTLYGVLGTPSFAQWHGVVGTLLQSAVVRLVVAFRHVQPSAGQVWPTTRLSGYGVGLDVKRMEYKAVDDRDADHVAEELQNGQGVLQEWEGDGFHVEQALGGSLSPPPPLPEPDHPDKDALLLQAWGQVGAAATTYLHAVGQAGAAGEHGQLGQVDTDPLLALQRLTGNFPAVAHTLRAVTPHPRVGYESRWNRRFTGGQDLVLVNGRLVDATSPAFNFFQLLSTWQEEAAVLSGMAQLPLPGTAVTALRALGGAEEGGDPEAGDAPEPGADVLRVDVRRGARSAVFWLNNIERDAQFKSWKRSVSLLRQRSMRGMPPVRRNLYTALLVLDLSKPASLQALATASYFVQAGQPIRMGVVPVITPGSLGYAHVDPNSKRSVEALPKPSSRQRPATALQTALVFAAAVEHHGTSAGVAFLQQLAQVWMEASQAANRAAMLAQSDTPQAAVQLSLEDVITAYASSMKTFTDSWLSDSFRGEALQALEDADGALRKRLRRIAAYVAARGLPVPSITLNGRVHKGSDVAEGVQVALAADMQLFAELVAQRKLTDRMLKKTSPLSFLLERSITLPAYAPALFAEEQTSLPLAVPDNALWLDALPWLSGGDQPQASNVSVVAFADLDSREGMQLAASVLALATAPEAADASPDGKAEEDASFVPDARVTLVHTGSWKAHSPGAALGALLHCYLPARGTPAPAHEAARVIAATVDSLLTAEEVSVERVHEAAEAAAGAAAHPTISTCHTDAHKRTIGAAGGAVKASWAREVLQAATGAAPGSDGLGLSVNARLYWADGAGAHTLPRPEAALALDRAQKGGAVAALVAKHESFEFDDGLQVTQATATAAACAALAAYTAGGERRSLPERHMLGNHTLIQSRPARALQRTGVDIVAVLNPTSEAAQRAAPLLLLARDRLGADVRVYLTPTSDASDMPLQSYYRFVAPGVGKLVAGPQQALADRAFLSHLPPAPTLLTAKVYPPEAWNVQALSAQYDMDNLKLGLPGMPRTVHVTYELKNLLLAGQCEDLTHSKPPNGLQLELRGDSGRVSDTLVMQNLGYFQLKANPGVWDIALADGRAAELYEITQPPAADAAAHGALRRVQRSRFFVEPEDGEEAPAVSSQQVVVRDFLGQITQLRVRKQAGKEQEQLLATLGGDTGDSASAGGDLWTSVSSLFGSKKHGGSNETIHVFSLASGHLYERFLRIMMLSVTKRASRPVHFWLVENFLSPAFKNTIEYFAERYGFDVSFVTYKWPNWLNGQTEKQRIIWGYKILFLDVLFPLNVTKIITVDADQVVRADLAELWDMDLGGAPYGYTPFCDSRAETLGFQFWRSGYWKNHLGPRPYHISALYVVDLVRFRQTAVGDTLRSVYDQLSRDPNSLSNLDQDLPNFAQNQVPIKSLPIEWLWCESWCSDDSKAAAKTIDLCNNPLHKEPKLDMARRVISGPLFQESWVQLDAEVAAVLQQAEQGLPHGEPAKAAAQESAVKEATQWYSTHDVLSPWERVAAAEVGADGSTAVKEEDASPEHSTAPATKGAKGKKQGGKRSSKKSKAKRKGKAKRKKA